MPHINIEIKAFSEDQDHIRNILKSRNADYKGTDHQIDTYFQIKHGRLKIREGNIENYLIFYNRENIDGPKQSNVNLYSIEPQSPLKNILVQSLGVLTIVDKHREIYFIDNIKFHIDSVKDLGNFIEIEARDVDGTLGKETLSVQCQEYLELFQINNSSLITGSYSDLLLNK